MERLRAKAEELFNVGENLTKRERLTAYVPHLIDRIAAKAQAKGYRFWLYELPSNRHEMARRSAGEFERYVQLLISTGCIDNGKKIYWDLRPHPFFGTLEFRVCDIPCRAEETVGIAALCQALVAKLHRLFESNLGIRSYPRAVLEENKFRGLKTGLDGKMIDFGLKQEAPTRALILEILNFVDDVLDDLGIREEVRFLHAWAASGDTGADRQLRHFQRTGSLPAVVDMLVDETRRGL